MLAELIKAYASSPVGKKIVPDFDVKHSEGNNICGDSIDIYLKIDNNWIVQDFGWQGEPKITTIVGASLLAEEIIGKSIDEVLNWTFDFFEQRGVEVSDRRKRSVVFPLVVTQNAIKKYKGLPPSQWTATEDLI